jgi:hypothetical protein
LKDLCAIKTLKKLTLHLGPIKKLPKEIGNLENLESFHIDNNELTELPEELGKLTKVHTFYAYSNKLGSLPDAFGDMASLRKLVLWSNQLKELPESFGNLKKLTEVELKWNPLKSIPDSFGSLENLEEADIQDAKLSVLPEDLSGMKKLRRFKLGTNAFKEFPRGLLTLPAIVEIDLSENQLTSIPDDIDRLKTLREVRFDQNKIKTLPKTIYSMALTAVKLDENQLKEIPVEFAKMPTLKALRLDGNPIPGLEEMPHLKNELFQKLGLWQPKVMQDDVPADKKEREAIVAKYKVAIEKFARDAKREPKTPAIVAFLKGEGNTVPTPDLEDCEEYRVSEILKPFAEWTFVDRRALTFMCQDSWRYKNPGYDYFRGYDDRVYNWLQEQIQEEPEDSTLFTDVARLILANGIDETTLLTGALDELHENLLRGDGKPTSFGKYLIARANDLVAFFQTRKYASQEALVGLLLRHAKDVFMKIGDKLLVIAPDEDDEIHVPYDALEQACAVDPARYEGLLVKAVEISNCDPCRAEAARVLAKAFPKYRGKALDIAKKTLKLISERKNKEERYEFSWSGGERWSDGTARYIAWMFSTFGEEVHADVQTFVEDTKVFDLDVAEVVAKSLGQKAIDMLGEGLKMSFDDGSIAPHFRRMFGMLAPLDWSKYHAKAWELARSEFREVRETACLALSRLEPKLVVSQAKELLDAKKGHEREAGVLILSLVNDAECKKILEGLLDTEKSDDARDIIVSSYFDAKEKIDRKEATRRVESAEGRGKLDKPVAKWLDEKKLPKLHWNKSKDALEALTVRFLFHRQTRQGEIAFDPEARGVIALIDRSKAEPFASKVLALVLKNGGVSAKTRFALTLIGALGGDDVVETLEEIAIEGKNENAVRTIGLIGSMAAARSLDRIIKVFRTKYPNVREPAQEAFAAIAEGLGKTPFELADSMIPDFKLEIGPDQKIVWKDKKKKDKDLEAEVKECTKALKSSLEYYLIVRRRWEPGAWAAFFEKNVLANSFALGFVWASYAGGKPKTIFRLTKDGERVGADGKVVSVQKDLEIGLVHPLEIPLEIRAQWIAAMAAAGIKPAFAQLDRPTFATSEDERARAKCFRFEDRELNGLTFKGRAERLGWRRGSVIDSGEVSAYRKLFPHDKIEVFIGTSGLGVQSYDMDSEVTLKDLFFVRPGAIVTGSYTYDEPHDEDDERLVKLGDVPPIVFSEAIADLTAITKTKDDVDS